MISVAHRPAPRRRFDPHALADAQASLSVVGLVPILILGIASCGLLLPATHPRRKTITLRLIAVATALLLVAAACGNDDTNDSGSAATSSPTATAEATAETDATEAPADTEDPAPAEAPVTNLTEGCVEDYDPEVDYFPDKITVEEATDFEVRYENNYKVLTVRTDLVYEGMDP